MTEPIHTQRMTAVMDGEFCVFLIGMRINRPLKVHKWSVDIAELDEDRVKGQ